MRNRLLGLEHGGRCHSADGGQHGHDSETGMEPLLDRPRRHARSLRSLRNRPSPFGMPEISSESSRWLGSMVHTTRLAWFMLHEIGIR